MLSIAKHLIEIVTSILEILRFTQDDILYRIRICLDFTANKFYVILFSLFEALFTIFTLFVLANRPLFAATKQCKSAQKHLSTKLEIKSKQILSFSKKVGLIFDFKNWILVTFLSFFLHVF